MDRGEVRERLKRTAQQGKDRLRDTQERLLRPLVDLQEATLQATQVQLVLRYQEMVRSGAPLPHFRDVGFRVHGDTDEDGILLYLFALLGSGRRRVVDIGAASAAASNTANLILRHGWSGLLVEGDQRSVEHAREHYEARLAYPPQVVQAFVTAENVNTVLADAGTTGEIDLLSIDIDGMDYWIWRAIDVVDPRVVVIEFQDILGPHRSVTVPYDADFHRDAYAVNATSNDYVGASLAAMVTLGREKGYRLVGVNDLGFNAFFVKDGLGADLLPEVEPAACLVHPWNEYGERVRYPRVSAMPWVEV